MGQEDIIRIKRVNEKIESWTERAGMGKHPIATSDDSVYAWAKRSNFSLVSMLLGLEKNRESLKDDILKFAKGTPGKNGKPGKIGSYKTLQNEKSLDAAKRTHNDIKAAALAVLGDLIRNAEPARASPTPPQNFVKMLGCLDVARE